MSKWKHYIHWIPLFKMNLLTLRSDFCFCWKVAYQPVSSLLSFFNDSLYSHILGITMQN
jgi:hypothetical protein